MINYLLTQIQGLETQNLNSQKRNNDLNEKERDAAQKRILDIKI